MLKSEDAAIHIQQMLNKVNLLAGTSQYDLMPRLVPFSPFDKRVVNFLDSLSKKLLNHKDSRTFPEIATFAFFCRKANVNILKRPYEDKITQSLGRGVTFHIGPSNVPINFAYSLISGLLAGNACIVRVSSKPFAQTTIICDSINEIFKIDEFSEIKRRIAIIQYGHHAELNSYFSCLCDVRIIWGGDNTISEIRKTANLPPRSFDITFSDRYSLCIVNAKNYLSIENKERVANDFYNDTYLFDQNACSSPKLVYWLGSNSDVIEAKSHFWGQVDLVLNKKEYNLMPVVAVDKFTASCKAAFDYKEVKIVKGIDNLISRIELKSLQLDLPSHACAGGSFFEYTNESLDPLAEIVTRKFQTVSYIGMNKDELVDFFIKKGTIGVDRVVPCGKASDFSIVWDGYDLILQMSRVVSIN
jgi:hypothetical protein